MAQYLDYVGNGSASPGGHYRLGLKTGLTTILAGGTCLLAFRWNDPAHWLVLLNFRSSANINTAFTTAQIVDTFLFFNRQWSTAPTAGTTVTPFLSYENQVRDSGAAPMFSQLQQFLPNVQIASTTAVTTGTRVQDTLPIAYSQYGNANALGNSAEQEPVKTNFGFEYPLMFAQNEGFEVQVGTTQGAVGKVLYYFSMVLAVVPAF